MQIAFYFQLQGLPPPEFDRFLQAVQQAAPHLGLIGQETNVISANRSCSLDEEHQLKKELRAAVRQAKEQTCYSQLIAIQCIKTDDPMLA
jgi:hypothetical protein